MTKEELEVVESIVQILLGCERCSLQDLRNQIHFDEVKTNLLIHEAREIVRTQHGIDFAPIKGYGDHIHRASPGQIRERSLRGRRAGLRKLDRAQERMSLAADKIEDIKLKEKFQRAADHQKIQLVNAKIRQKRVLAP